MGSEGPEHPQASLPLPGLQASVSSSVRSGPPEAALRGAEDTGGGRAGPSPPARARLLLLWARRGALTFQGTFSLGTGKRVMGELG